MHQTMQHTARFTVKSRISCAPARAFMCFRQVQTPSLVERAPKQLSITPQAPLYTCMFQPLLRLPAMAVDTSGAFLLFNRCSTGQRNQGAGEVCGWGCSASHDQSRRRRAQSRQQRVSSLQYSSSSTAACGFPAAPPPGAPPAVPFDAAAPATAARSAPSRRA